MKRLTFRCAVAALTFTLGVSTAMLIDKFRAPVRSNQPRPAQTVDMKAAVSVNPAAPFKTYIPPRLASLSPYEIKYFINNNPQTDIQDIWQRLGLASANSSGHHTFFANCNDCKAQTFEYDLDGEMGREVLLRVADDMLETCRYLIFKSTDPYSDKWKVFGHIDYDFGKYRMPQHSYFLSGGKSWLVVQAQGGSGSGVSLYYDRVFSIDEKGMKEVLSYVSDGHQSGYGLDPSRQFEARIIGYQEQHQRATFEVEFSVTYDDDGTMFSKQQKAVFVRRPKSGKYYLDAAASDLSQNELESVYNIDSLSNEDFLNYNYDDLLKIAVGENRERRKWLSQFLDECSNVPQKQKLRKALMSDK